MRKALAVLVATMLAMMGVVGCSRTESPVGTLPIVMKTCFVVGAYTPEAIFLEVDWLELIS